MLSIRRDLPFTSITEDDQRYILKKKKIEFKIY